MFDRLTQRFDDVFRKLSGRGKISERNVDEALREIRRALLEADVNFKVARSFIQRIRERAIGHEVMRSLTPGQQVIKLVHEELVTLLGGENSPLRLADRPPTIVLLVGLQGCGKTTVAAKLALRFKEQGRPPLLVAADVYRPAAVDQLQTLGAAIDVPVYAQAPPSDPLEICLGGIEEARRSNRSIAVVDTAGRLGIDAEMMEELVAIKAGISPDEILFVADAMLGQDAVETAARFHEGLAFSGCVLTKMDGDARGGAALSIREVTGAPVKFIGSGERPNDLESFHPDRMAGRILGMGDVLSLVEKAEQAFERRKMEKMEERLRRQSFTFDDFLEQVDAIRKMGPLDQVMGMIPGGNSALKGVPVNQSAFGQVEAIIQSMTTEERRSPQILNGSRRKRIARGSGTTVQDVNRLVKQFQTMQKMMKQMNRRKPGKMQFNMPFMG